MKPKEEIKLLARLLMCVGLTIEDWEPDIFCDTNEAKRLLDCCCSILDGKKVVILEFDFETRVLQVLKSKFKICDETDLVFVQDEVNFGEQLRECLAIKYMNTIKAITVTSLEPEVAKREYKRNRIESFELKERSDYGRHYIYNKTYEEFCKERCKVAYERGIDFARKMSKVYFEGPADLMHECELGNVSQPDLAKLMEGLEISSQVAIITTDKEKYRYALDKLTEWSEGYLNVYLVLEPEEFLFMIKQSLQTTTYFNNEEITVRHKIYDKLEQRDKKIYDL